MTTKQEGGPSLVASDPHLAILHPTLEDSTRQPAPTELERALASVEELTAQNLRLTNEVENFKRNESTLGQKLFGAAKKEVELRAELFDLRDKLIGTETLLNTERFARKQEVGFDALVAENIALHAKVKDLREKLTAVQIAVTVALV